MQMMYDAHADKMTCWPNMLKKVLNLLRQNKDRILITSLGSLIPEDCVTLGSQTASGNMSLFLDFFLKMRLVEWKLWNFHSACDGDVFVKKKRYHSTALHEI